METTPDRWLRVLVVDDSPVLRGLYRDTLEQLGVSVLEAEDGARAVLELQENRYEVDCVLADWRMPRLDGLAFLREIKRVSNLQRLPVIMLTDGTYDGRMREALQCGCDGFLLRPFSAEVFLRAFVALLPAEQTRVVEPYVETPPRAPFLDLLPDELRSRIVNMSYPVELELGQTVLYRGKDTEYLQFVVSGRLTEKQPAAGFDGVLMREYRRGECFAVTEMLASDPLYSSYQAAEATTIGRIPKVAFESMLGQSPELSRILTNCISHKARSFVIERPAVDPGAAMENHDLTTVVLALSLRQRTCVLMLPEIEGEIVFHHGQVVAVRHLEQGLSGRDAFVRILESRPRSFRLLHRHIDDDCNIHQSTVSLLKDCRAIAKQRDPVVSDV